VVKGNNHASRHRAAEENTSAATILDNGRGILSSELAEEKKKERIHSVMYDD
jgi:hypothetical protein